MTPWRRRARHVRLGIQALVATIVIGAALVVGLARLALPWIASHPERISAFLAERLHQPVSIDQVEGRWERDGPLLTLRGVHIGSDQPDAAKLQIAQAGLKINLLSILHSNAPWNEFLLDGLDLNLVRGADAGWQLRGLSSGDSSDSGDPRALLGLGALTLRNITLSIDDAVSARQFRFGADEVRLLNSGDIHRVAARVRSLQTKSAPFDTVIEYDSGKDTGVVYVGGASLDVAAILHGHPLFGATVVRGIGRAQVWGRWSAGRIGEVRAEVGLNDLLLDAQTPVELDEKRRIAPRVSFDKIEFGARWLRGEHGWSVDVDKLTVARQGATLAPASLHVESRKDAEQSEPAYVVQAQDIDISAPASVVMLAEDLPMPWRRWLYAGNPEGTLDALVLRWSGSEDFDVAASVDNMGWHALDQVPGVVGLSGILRGDQLALTMGLAGHNELSVDVPHVFRRSLDFSEFAGDVAAYRADSAWRIETDAVRFEGVGYGGELRGSIDFPDAGGRPLIDACALVEHADVQASHLFWPINTMPPAAVSWLDRGLDAGRVVGGRAVIRGDLTDWPFRNYSGRFQARAEIDDLLLKYLPDWPAAEHVRLAADFVNTSLRVSVEAGQVKGIRLNHASADIGDLGEPLLELEADAQGAGEDLLGLLKATPIGQRFGVQLLGVDVGGQGKVNFHLHLPIKHSEQLALTGTVVLSDADLVDAKYALRLNRANGKLRFSQAGFVADDLAVMMEGQPASFALSVGAFTADPKHEVEATLGASLPAAFVLAYAPALSAYGDYVEGIANWSAAFSADSGASNAQHLLLTSDLRGVALTLPAPLNKAAGAVLPLRVSLGLPFGGGSVDLQVGDVLRMHGRLPLGNSPFAARVTFGGDSEEAVPRSGMAIGGKTPVLDLSGWLDFATSGRSDDGNGTTLNSIDLRADSMTAYGRDFGPTRFTLGRAADGLDMGFTGAAVEGTLHVPSTDLRKHGITAQFARLYWPESNDSEGDGGSAANGENPASVPPLHIHIGDFRLGDKNFGESVVETYPIAGGSHFEQVSTHSSNIEMRAHGDWTGRPGSDTSTFAIEMTAHNIGRMLDAFGYAGVIDGGATVAHIEGSWAGPPSSFALTKLDGTLKTSIKKGRIPDADPGSARVLGLFNLAAIPRRLAFDFGDLFKTGFSFDSIDGTFKLKDGNAHTEDLKVLSPTADMLLKGRMGLKDKDWDQTIQVTPHVGGTLAIGGALIAGPVGAAAGALIQGVFNKQINSVARAEYKVSGSWDNPKITVIKKETVKNKPDVKSGSEKLPGSPPPPKTADPQKGS